MPTSGHAGRGGVDAVAATVGRIEEPLGLNNVDGGVERDVGRILFRAVPWRAKLLHCLISVHGETHLAA